LQVELQLLRVRHLHRPAQRCSCSGAAAMGQVSQQESEGSLIMMGGRSVMLSHIWCDSFYTLSVSSSVADP
jgi:hypothetical protein